MVVLPASFGGGIGVKLPGNLEELLCFGYEDLPVLADLYEEHGLGLSAFWVRWCLYSREGELESEDKAMRHFEYAADFILRNWRYVLAKVYPFCPPEGRRESVG